MAFPDNGEPVRGRAKNADIKFDQTVRWQTLTPD
jgi:hypothetical protein